MVYQECTWYWKGDIAIVGCIARGLEEVSMAKGPAGWVVWGDVEALPHAQDGDELEVIGGISCIYGA